MALKVEKRDGTGERVVLTSMMVSRHVLGAVAARWEPPGLFGSRWSNIAGGWAVQHYGKYNKPPGRHLQGYFDAWAESGRDPDTVATLDAFLAGLSDEYERLKKHVSPDYVLDQAARLFNRVRLGQLKEGLEGDLEVGDVEKARERVEGFRPVEVGTGAGIEVLSDAAAVQSAFEERGTVLVEYEGALKEFFATALGRDQLVAFMGKDKVGKSFFLQDLAFRAVEQGLRVAYFECGDSSQHQVLRRFASRAAGHPIDPCRYFIPTSIEPGVTNGLPDMEHDMRTAAEGLTPEVATKALKKLGRRVGEDRFKLSCHPNSSLSVRAAQSILETWQRDGWVPDVVLFDYADIMAPLDSKAESRVQIDATWRALRALSQQWHCLVATATQCDAAGYTARVLTRTNFNGSKTINAHTTAIFGINQTDSEKEQGLYRLNPVVFRDLAFSEERCVWVAGSLAVCNPCMISTY